MGDASLENCTKHCNPESVMVANGILNEILDKALEIALSSNYDNKDTNKMNIIDEIREDPTNFEIPAIKLEHDMKKLLSEMMSPPFEIVNYDNLPRKDGVGDQPTKNLDTQIRPSNCIEKKSRITDLVMNSKKVLNNLLDEEERKKQDEWEEHNEHIIQVIELEKQPNEDEEILNLPDDSAMEAIDLQGGEGDDGKLEEIESNASANDSHGEKRSECKKKKWNFNFKFLGFRKNRSKQSQSSSNTTVVEK